MKKKSKHAHLKRKKEFRFHAIKVPTKKGKQKTIEHPAYIFLEKGNVYIYVPITHSSSVNDFMVIKLRKNPDPNDNRDSYYIADIRMDTKDSFSAMKKKWELDSKDDEEIRSLFNKKNDSADWD